jgi:hypothetical protein
MKKLVKTAKQQFEERLSELKVIDKENTGGSFTYYLCEDEEGRCIILERGEDTFPIYSEITMSGTILDVYTDEDFLASLVNYWIEVTQEPLKILFDWYASADKENPPFGIQTMAQLSSDASSATFSDLYEEVADVRIITAKEQWEEDSKDAKVAATLGNGSIYKVDVTEQAITFYVFKGDCYSKSVFPPFSELRKDNKFIIKYLELVRMSHDGDMDYALSWLAGGEYKMCELSLLDIYESAAEIEGLEYEDKELPREQTIEEVIALTPEQQEKVKEFEVALKALKDSGVKIISYWNENDFYAINGNTKLEFDCVTSDGHEDISNLLENKHRFPFSWDIYWGCDSCFCAKKL